MSDVLADGDNNSTNVKRYWEMTDDDIDYSDIPKMSKEELAGCKGRFPNISQQKLEGIRALVNRQGIEKITRENLDLAKQRWKEAEDAWEKQRLICHSTQQAKDAPLTVDTRVAFGAL